MPIPRSPSGVYMLCKNSDRSVSSYNIHWSCVCCWGDGSGQNAVPAPKHPPASWLLPLSCSSLKLLFLYCISGRVSRGFLVPGEQLAFRPPNLPACSFLSSPFLLLHSGLLAFQQKKCKLELHSNDHSTACMIVYCTHHCMTCGERSGQTSMIGLC